MANNNKHLTLDEPPEVFQTWLTNAVSLILERFEGLDQQKIYPNYTQEEVAAWFDEPLPERGQDMDTLLAEIKQKVLDTATLNMGPHMYAYVNAGGTQASIIAEMLIATLDQNVAKWHLSPAMHEIEKRVIQWASTIIGYAPNAGGVLVSGGSAANLTGLTVARNLWMTKEDVRKKGLFNQSPLTVYASTEVHACIDKSIEMLGIGTDQLRKISTHDDFTIDLEALEAAILEDQKSGLRPFCVVGNAGTVNTGHIDDLSALADLADKHKMWFHVDGAYGGLAASIEALKPKYKGIERAHSVALDFHKWLYQPFEAGCLLLRRQSQLREAYHIPVSYMDAMKEEPGRINWTEHHFQLSKNAKAFKVWMSLKAYGFPAIRAMIEKDIQLTRYLGEVMDEATDFEVVSRGPLGIICFRYLPKNGDVLAFNRQLVAELEKDGRIFIAGTLLKGSFVIRACLNNHRKTKRTTDYLMKVVREVAQTINNT